LIARDEQQSVHWQNQTANSDTVYKRSTTQIVVTLKAPGVVLMPDRLQLVATFLFFALLLGVPA
jgi:hypothetical protein